MPEMGSQDRQAGVVHKSDDEAIGLLQVAATVAGSSGSEKKTKDNLLEMPKNTTSVKINIGPNSDPSIFCPPHGGEFCLLLDIQHSVVQKLRKKYQGNANMVALWLGISDFRGLAHFQIHGGGHTGSTSLSTPAYRSDWNTVDQGSDYAPVMTLADILASISPALPITLLATDMQGHDFAAIRSAGEHLKRVQRVQSEVWDHASTFNGVSNDLTRDWLPRRMKSMGFALESCFQAFQEKKADGHANEKDCTFVNVGGTSGQ